MNDKLSPDDPLPTRTEAEGATVDLPEGLGFFTTGQVLGDRYEILEMLGRGGMGEVWRAFDLKLRVEVGLKALREEFFQSERRLELLRQEVRAAREVVSPNVCRIFDLIEIDGRELVSMEYVDGATLLGVLQERGPLDLKEAQDIASQFLAGLEAIHKAGLVHRDVKPENIMLTRAGRVVVMDFGLARGPESGAGSVSGTPAYMAPEHAAGQDVDARADVYSAGVVLAEMVSPEGIKSYESRQSVWEGMRSEPAKLPDSPWAPVLKRAVARDRERRPNSAHTLIRELEDVTLRVEGAEDLHPYPGLASFTEEDAEYFFGREAEVERLWRKLDGPSRLLALVGPSGAGKTSFLQAGLVAHAGPDWRCVISKPGTNPVLGLSRALAPEMAGDVEAMDLLLRFDDPETALEVVSRWRQTTDNALIIVDQFEELFTQNAHGEQRRFAELLGRLALEADAFVILSMRDDFMMRCRDLEALEPIFSEMTALPALAGGSLRRALVRPATKCGYRFEDDELVVEILAEVEGERGALPMLAFAASRMWEKRDREAGLLTRQAYHDIGGVGGALARHAEATVDRIGVERIPVVRELFRNLVTAEGTRAVREWDELLSVFEDGRVRKLESENVRKSALPSVASKTLGARRFTPHSERSERFPSHSERSERSPSDSSPARAAASDVLRELIDARLLTSYEVREDEHEPIRRVEIIHESLLANWPRLVRWQTQDQEGAQLRDELRQSARTWDEHGRHDDRLWTGTAYREYRLWRERYPGGLTEAEEEFGEAMISFANRRKRRRRIAVIATVAVFVIIASVFAGLWQRSVLHQRRSDAQKLIALGQLELEPYPSSTIAHAIASLELADSKTARLLALRALWEGPSALVVNETASIFTSFGPDGKWLVQSHEGTSSISVISRAGDQRSLDHPTESGTTRVWARFQQDNEVFLSLGQGSDTGRFALWSAPEGRLLATAKPFAEPFGFFGHAIVTHQQATKGLFLLGKDNLLTVEALGADGTHERLWEYPLSSPVSENVGCITLTGEWFAFSDGRKIYTVNVGPGGFSEPLFLGEHDGVGFTGWRADPLGRYFLTFSRNGHVRRWSPSGELPPVDFEVPAGTAPAHLGTEGHLSAAHRPTGVEIWFLDESGLNLVRGFRELNFEYPAFDWVGLHFAMRGPAPAHRLWRLRSPVAANPLVLRSGPGGYAQQPQFSPDGRWLATNDSTGLTMWPLAREYPAIIDVDFHPWSGGVAFDPGGGFLVTAANTDIRILPLDGPVPSDDHPAFTTGGSTTGVSVSPNGKLIAAGSHGPEVWIGRAGEEPKALFGKEEPHSGTDSVSFSPDGRFVAARDGGYNPSKGVFRVWEVSTGEEVSVLQPEEGVFALVSPGFSADGRLLVATTGGGVYAWSTQTGDLDLLVDIPVAMAVTNATGRRLLAVRKDETNSHPWVGTGSPMYCDLETGERTVLAAHGSNILRIALDDQGIMTVSGDRDGTIRVGPVTDEEPHLLLGHEGEIRDLAVDPLGRWIASASVDGTLRLWPMPDLSKPPLHTLPREELIAKLKTLTNLRVVHDPDSATGWKLTHDPFPGWETLPTW